MSSEFERALHGADDRIKLLSLAGGGFLGLYTALVLEYLEEPLKKRSSDARLCQVFKLVAGTSVGGLLALGIAFGLPASELVKVLQEVGRQTFKPRILPNLMGMLWGPIYKPDAIASAIADKIGAEKKLNQAKIPVVVPALNLTLNRLEVFRGIPGEQQGSDIRVIDVALATMAAPMYFPAHKIGELLYADGGLVANCPDLIALKFAHELGFRDTTRWHLMSIGTTLAPSSFSTDTHGALGLLGWLRHDLRLLRTAMQSQMLHVRDLALTGLGDKTAYVCIDAFQTSEQSEYLKIDSADPESMKTIQRLFEATLSDSSIGLEAVRLHWVG